MSRRPCHIERACEVADFICGWNLFRKQQQEFTTHIDLSNNLRGSALNEGYEFARREAARTGRLIVDMTHDEVPAAVDRNRG